MTFKQGTMIRNSLIWCGLAAGIILSGSAFGQYYPIRQIIILVGIAAGGITDVTTRQYAAVLSKNMDQNIIVENRPIAGGAIAAAAVQSAAPDGYTLLSGVGSQFLLGPGHGTCSLRSCEGLCSDQLDVSASDTPRRAHGQPSKDRGRPARLGENKAWRPATWLSWCRYPRPSACRQNCARHQYADSIHPLSRRRAGDGRSHHRTRGFQPRLLQQRPVEYGRQEASRARCRCRDAD